MSRGRETQLLKKLRACIQLLRQILFCSILFFMENRKCVPQIYSQEQKTKKQLQSKLSNVDVFVFVFGGSPVTTCNTFLSSKTPPSFWDNTASILSENHITSNFCPRWLICRGHDMPIQGPLQSDSLHSAWRSSIFLKADVKDGQCLQKRRQKNAHHLPSCLALHLACNFEAEDPSAAVGFFNFHPWHLRALTAGLNLQCFPFCDVLLGTATTTPLI